MSTHKSILFVCIGQQIAIAYACICKIFNWIRPNKSYICICNILEFLAVVTNDIQGKTIFRIPHSMCNRVVVLYVIEQSITLVLSRHRI